MQAEKPRKRIGKSGHNHLFKNSFMRYYFFSLWYLLGNKIQKSPCSFLRPLGFMPGNSQSSAKLSDPHPRVHRSP